MLHALVRRTPHANALLPEDAFTVFRVNVPGSAFDLEVDGVKSEGEVMTSLEG